MTDIVREIIDRVRVRIAEAYGLPDEVEALLGEVEEEIKSARGGERHYVPVAGSRLAPRASPAAVVRDYLADVAIEDIQSRHGISRRTIYNYLKRR